MTESKLVPGLEKLQMAINDAAVMHSQLPGCFPDLAAIASLCARCLKSNGKILFCGNGGSASEAQHLATEFVVRLSAKRNRKALPAINIASDSGLITACANDFGFERVFARQVEALMNPGDVLILLSTSGKSPNLLAAAQAADQIGGLTVAFLGKDSSPLSAMVRHSLHIPSPSGQRVQEAHLLCGHMLVELVEDMLFGVPPAVESERS